MNKPGIAEEKEKIVSLFHTNVYWHMDWYRKLHNNILMFIGTWYRKLHNNILTFLAQASFSLNLTTQTLNDKAYNYQTFSF